MNLHMFLLQLHTHNEKAAFYRRQHRRRRALAEEQKAHGSSLREARGNQEKRILNHDGGVYEQQCCYQLQVMY